MKVALYLRVSTLEQTNLNQELELKLYCERNGHQIYKIYEDKMSGSKTSRPQFDIMLQDMRLNQFEAVIIWKLDRLGRLSINLLNILQEMQSKGVDLIITTQGIDTTTIGGKLIYTIFAAIAEWERETIRERIQLGLKRAKSEGIILGRRFGSTDKLKRNNIKYFGNKNRQKVTV